MSVLTCRRIAEQDPSFRTYSCGEGLNWDFWKMGWWSRMHEYRWMMEALCERFKGPRKGSVIGFDAGCGCEHPGPFIMHDSGIDMVHAADMFEPDTYTYKYAMGEWGRYVKEDICRPGTMQYDVVCCISVVEHIRRKDLALKGLIDRVNKEGCLVLTVDLFPGDREDWMMDELSKAGFNMRSEPFDPQWKELNSATSPISGRQGRKRLSIARIFADRRPLP